MTVRTGTRRRLVTSNDGDFARTIRVCAHAKVAVKRVAPKSAFGYGSRARLLGECVLDLLPRLALDHGDFARARSSPSRSPQRRSSPGICAAASTAAPGPTTARARPRPARRPASARCRRPGARAWRSGPRAAGAIAFRQIASRAGRHVRLDLPRAAGSRPAAPGRSTSADVAARRTAAGRSAGGRASRPGCRRRWPGRAVEVARGLLGAHVGRRADRRARQRLGRAAGRRRPERRLRASRPPRAGRRPWPGPSRPPGSRRTGRA